MLALRRMRERTRSLQGQPARETITVCAGLLEKARSLGDRAEESALLTMISHCQDRLGDGAAAERVAREAVAAAQAADDSRLLAESLTRLGSVDQGHQRRRGSGFLRPRADALPRRGRPQRRGALPHQHREDPPARRRHGRRGSGLRPRLGDGAVGAGGRSRRARVTQPGTAPSPPRPARAGRRALRRRARAFHRIVERNRPAVDAVQHGPPGPREPRTGPPRRRCTSR